MRNGEWMDMKPRTRMKLISKDASEIIRDQTLSLLTLDNIPGCLGSREALKQDFRYLIFFV